MAKLGNRNLRQRSCCDLCFKENSFRSHSLGVDFYRLPSYGVYLLIGSVSENCSRRHSLDTDF